MEKIKPKPKPIVILLIVLLSLFIYACGSPDVFTSPEVNIVTSYSGSFEGTSGHPTSGQALVNSNKTQLLLSSFYTIKGPDLRVWLATSKSPINYRSLGELRYEGNQNYNLPIGINLDKYQYVLIWCKKFSVLFSSAKLVKVVK